MADSMLPVQGAQVQSQGTKIAHASTKFQKAANKTQHSQIYLKKTKQTNKHKTASAFWKQSSR